jgi:hypothetical protein
LVGRLPFSHNAHPSCARAECRASTLPPSLSLYSSLLHCWRDPLFRIYSGWEKERMNKKPKSVHHRKYLRKGIEYWWHELRWRLTRWTTHTHTLLLDFWLLPSSSFLFSFFCFSHFLFLSWRFNVGVKKSLDVFLPFFCKNQQLSPFFPSSSFLLPPLSAGLCCWADERAEAFEFGYLIVLAFGSYACVCNAYGACLTR